MSALKPLQRPILVATDMEGCLVPEIWIGLAEKTGIAELRLTTRDISDYDELMQGRLKILDEHGISLHDLEAVIAAMGPLPGAREYLDWLRARVPLVILSDTFYEFARPLMKALDEPCLFCHTLTIDENDRIRGYRLRTTDGKRGAVEGFRTNGFSVIAIGDSYNDTSMLRAADQGILFRAPANVRAEFPQFPHCSEYAELISLLVECGIPA
ncbi:MAG: bifunctional phosphoserine phosphatase/homoserine phosphotransferase ThrH [Leptospiraceae bacterium]|nr:bifunctional phosphoserine phosphatase/homoserine phosphotransferase ThrH [Leptospiraceae bacterium]